MNDPASVGGGQPVADLDGNFHGATYRKGSSFQPLPQRLALEQLEYDEGRAVLRAHVVQGEDVGVVEGRDGSGLVLEAAEAVRVRGAVGGYDLDGDIAAETGVARAVHLAHPSGTQEGEKLVRAETTARGQ